MPRKPRREIVSPDTYMHIIVRGNNKMRIFIDALDYRRYELTLLEAAERYSVEVKKYVLMPNHVHLLARPSENGISRFMQVLQLSYAKSFSRKYGHIGHVWQDRFKSLTITSDAYLETCDQYITLNPVRAGLVTKPELWPYMGTLLPQVPGTK